MPFKSKLQSRWMFGAARRGEIPLSVAKEWASHTDYSKLPKKVRKKVKKKASSPLSQMSSFSALPGAPAMPSAPTPPTIPTKFGPGTGFGGISMSPTRSRLLKPTLKTDLKPHAPENALTSPIKMAADEGNAELTGVAKSDLAKSPSEPLTPASVIAKSQAGAIIRPGVPRSSISPQPIEQMRQPPERPSALGQYVERIGRSFQTNPLGAASGYMNFGPMGMVTPGSLPIPAPSIPTKAGNFTLHVLKCADFALKSMLPSNTDAPKPQVAPQPAAAAPALPPTTGSPSTPPAAPLLTTPPAQPALNTKPTALDGLARSALPPIPPPSSMPSFNPMAMLGDVTKNTRPDSPTLNGATTPSAVGTMADFERDNPASTGAMFKRILGYAGKVANPTGFNPVSAVLAPDLMFGQPKREMLSADASQAMLESQKKDWAAYNEAKRLGKPNPLPYDPWERLDPPSVSSTALPFEPLIGTNPRAALSGIGGLTRLEGAALPASKMGPVAATGVRDAVPSAATMGREVAPVSTAIGRESVPVGSTVGREAIPAATSAAESATGAVAKTPMLTPRMGVRAGIDFTRPITTAMRNSDNPIVKNLGRAGDVALWPLRSMTGQQAWDITARNFGKPLSLRDGGNLLASLGLGSITSKAMMDADPNITPGEAYVGDKLKGPIYNLSLPKRLYENPGQTATDLGGNVYDGWRKPITAVDRTLGTAVKEDKDIPTAVWNTGKSFVRPMSSALEKGWDAGSSADISNASSTLDASSMQAIGGARGALTSLMTSVPATEKTDLTNPEKHYRLLGPSDEASRTSAAMDFVKGHPASASGILSRGVGGARDADQVAAYRDKFMASEFAGGSMPELGPDGKPVLGADGNPVMSSSADNWRKYTQSLAIRDGGKAPAQIPIDRPLGPSDFEGVPEAANFGEMIDGKTDPAAPGPFAKYTATSSALTAKYPNMRTDPKELAAARADPLWKEAEAAKRTYQGRAIEHYRDKVVKPLVEPTGLPSMVSRAKSIQEELASGKLSPEATQAKLAELQDVATKVQSGTTKILNYSLARAPLDGLLVKPNDLPPTVQDFMGELSKREPIKDASGNDTGMTRPATPLGQSFEQAVARDLAKKTGETPTPEQIQTTSNSMPELSKILVLGGLGLGAAGLISAMLGGGSMGAVLGLMGLVGVGAAAAHGYGGGQISSLFQGDTWKRFGMGVQGMAGGRSASSTASAPNPVENQKYVTLSALQSTPQFQDLVQGKVSPDQANRLLSAIHPGEQEAALQALAGQPGIQQTAKAFFERRAAYAAGQPTNPDDMLSAARPAFQAAGIDPNSASEAFKVLDQMRTNPDILYSRAQPVMDMLSQLSNVASDPNRLQALSTKLPPGMKAKLYAALQEHGNNPDLQRFLPPDKIARISAAIKPQ